MVTISRNDLQRLIVSCPDLKLVEVLSETSYQEFHLRGAINIPLNHHFEEQFLQKFPDKCQTIIVYSLNFECPISEQAMQRLLELGYQNIYDYEPGKIDWNAAQLPVEHGHYKTAVFTKQQGFLFP
ncbi:rhodanese-like domain-containing protein [uncultured Gimesia sp.]|uniref:rhodanese-like domain-containing protein n=1 Tax=uncultured Gimesia sp. TaxID=1678688 RepID=UPI0030D85D3E|tara:strand:+ start:6990 stop:7367 length:378 start_codon:yes stop_codon:yes gene_type:complete